MIEQAEEEADYKRLSTKELIVLASRGDDAALTELERREELRQAARKE